MMMMMMMNKITRKLLVELGSPRLFVVVANGTFKLSLEPAFALAAPSLWAPNVCHQGPKAAATVTGLDESKGPSYQGYFEEGPAHTVSSGPMAASMTVLRKSKGPSYQGYFENIHDGSGKTLDEPAGVGSMHV